MATRAILQSWISGFLASLSLDWFFYCFLNELNLSIDWTVEPIYDSVSEQLPSFILIVGMDFIIDG